MKLPASLIGFFLSGSCFSQELPSVPVHIDHNASTPQTRPNFDKIGQYAIAVTADKLEVDPGEKLNVRALITGYGKIGEGKVLLVPSSSNVFTDDSKVNFSLGTDDQGITIWGTESLPFNNYGNVISFVGGYTFRDGDSTILSDYVDTHPTPRSLMILTEAILRNAPLSLKLEVRRKADPGNYKMDFYFTYYNGNEWAISQATLNFRVTNYVERNGTWISFVGLALAFLALVPLFIQTFKFFRQLFFARSTAKAEVPPASTTEVPAQSKVKGGHKEKKKNR